MKALALVTVLLCGIHQEHNDSIHLTVDDIPHRPVIVYPVIPINGRQAIQEGKWIEKPYVFICHDGPVSETRVRRATQYWERLGYSFGPISTLNRGNEKCMTGDAVGGSITIDIPSQTFQFGTHLGQTRTWRWTATNEIFKARIEIIPAWGDSERILEHEIGHALGWMDMNSPGHIMHGVWSSGGHNSRGMRNENNER